MADDDDEEGFGGLYEDGHWTWNVSAKALVFESDLPPKPVEAMQILSKAPTGTVEFRDDVDLIEQVPAALSEETEAGSIGCSNDPGLPYLKAHKAVGPTALAVVTKQPPIRTGSEWWFMAHSPSIYKEGSCPRSGDIKWIYDDDVKDIAIYTAPLQILSPMLINMLHLPTTERFIRASTLYCAYYLQVADEMADRILELETKVRTPDCEILEHEYRDNLADLRLMVAKEYSVMLIGGSDTRKFHHMGPAKKRSSLSEKDARLFETLLRMCVQIIWLALGRKSFNQIELEMNRIFKSEIFNAVEHTLRTGYITKMTKEERLVLLGHCVRHDKKLNTRSPLMNEVFCYRPIDYRMMGLGVIKSHIMSPRLHYLLQAIAGHEEKLSELGVTVGIIGLSRHAFDTMLKPLPSGDGTKSKGSVSSSSGYSSKSSANSSMRKSTMTANKLYPDIVLPRKETREVFFPPSFPDEPEVIRPCSETQRRRWQTRLMKLLHPHG